MDTHSIDYLRRLALLAIFGGLIELGCVIAGYNRNAGAPTWLLIGAIVTVMYGLLGTFHLTMARAVASQVRPFVFVGLYWGFPLCALLAAVSALVSGLSGVAILLAELAQVAAIVLAGLWYRKALQEHLSSRARRNTAS